MASVILTPEAKKQVDALPLPIRRRLLDVYAPAGAVAGG